MCTRESERMSLWTSAKLKPALFKGTNSLPRKTRYVSSHFRRSYLKGNKAIKQVKMKGQRKLNRPTALQISFLKVCWCRLPKIVKISPCLSKLQLAKVVAFFETQCITSWIYCLNSRQKKHKHVVWANL